MKDWKLMAILMIPHHQSSRPVNFLAVQYFMPKDLRKALKTNILSGKRVSVWLLNSELNRMTECFITLVSPDHCKLDLGQKLQTAVVVLTRWPHFKILFFVAIILCACREKKRVNANDAGRRGLKCHCNYPAIIAAFHSWGGSEI